MNVLRFGTENWSREELDQHLDSTQVVLDNLREVLSLQGSPLDAATLLGVCDSFSFDPTLAIDPLCWSGTQRPPSPWNRHGAAGSHSDQHSLSPFDLLQTAKSVSVTASPALALHSCPLPHLASGKRTFSWISCRFKWLCLRKPLTRNGETESWAIRDIFIRLDLTLSRIGIFSS